MPEKSGKKVGKRTKSLSATRIIALVFAAIILVGTGLLMLPVASRSGHSSGFMTALFTATSSTCVTGLILADTYTQWSGFGQAVILCLIEIGGLGFMSAASVVVFLLRRKVGLKQRMVMAQAFSVSDMEGVVRLQKWVLGGSLCLQAAGAIVLFLRFLPGYGFRQAAIWGVFHSVSAFCNAGFDILGKIAPGQSMICMQSDPVVLITLMALITVGGLGFFVWEEVAAKRSFRKFSVYTKLVLLTSLGLILAGAALTLILEWNNPATIGNMCTGDKILNAFFQSVTLRTAGFVSFDQGAMTEGGKAVSILLMLVGGSSGSTAGGVKTVTVVVVLLFLWSRARGRSNTEVFRRNIPREKVLDAMTVLLIVSVLAVLGSVVLCTTSGVSFVDALYESVSALATVGVTTGITARLSVISKLLMIVFMYFGRVGVLTVSLGFLMGDKAAQRYRFADTNLLIG